MLFWLLSFLSIKYPWFVFLFRNNLSSYSIPVKDFHSVVANRVLTHLQAIWFAPVGIRAEDLTMGGNLLRFHSCLSLMIDSGSAEDQGLNRWDFRTIHCSFSGTANGISNILLVKGIYEDNSHWTLELSQKRENFENFKKRGESAQNFEDLLPIDIEISVWYQSQSIF